MAPPLVQRGVAKLEDLALITVASSYQGCTIKGSGQVQTCPDPRPAQTPDPRPQTCPDPRALVRGDTSPILKNYCCYCQLGQESAPGVSAAP